MLRRVIDMRSDTVTKPTAHMLSLLSHTPLGDDVYGEDPTVLSLESLGRGLTGKDSCAFVCSGTMGNLASFMSHCDRRSSEMIVGDRQHTYLHEQGGSAGLAGIHSRVVRNGKDGTLDVREVIRAVRGEDDVHYPRTILVSVENTHNMCGGVPLPLEYLKSLKEEVKKRGVKLHMDGARVCNAAVALGVDVQTVCEHVDSVTVCLSKGLGAPVGTLVCGDVEFIAGVRRAKKALGGGWRQAGLLAACGIVAIENMQETLTKDHMLAKSFAHELLTIPGVSLQPPQTNLVFFGVGGHCNLDSIVSEAKKLGLLFNSGYGLDGTLIRAAIHRDLSSEDVARAAEIMHSILATRT